jgi:hypothetical protein
MGSTAKIKFNALSMLTKRYVFWNKKVFAMPILGSTLPALTNPKFANIKNLDAAALKFDGGFKEN